MLLSAPKIKTYVPIILEEVNRLCDAWARLDGDAGVEVHTDVHSLTTKILVRLCFGTRILDDDPRLLDFIVHSSAVITSLNSGANERKLRGNV